MSIVIRIICSVQKWCQDWGRPGGKSVPGQWRRSGWRSGGELEGPGAGGRAQGVINSLHIDIQPHKGHVERQPVMEC